MKSMQRGARIIVETCMGVRMGEKVLLVTDPPRLRIAEVISEAARELGAETTLMCMPVGKRDGEEPPKTVGIAMKSFDVVIAPTTRSITHTQARLKATNVGTRIATMPLITEEMMRRGAILADYRKVRELTIKVAKLLDDASEVEVTTRAGTGLRFSINGRRAHPDTGIFHNRGDFGNLPAGEAFIAPLEGTGEGRVVVDGSILDSSTEGIEILIEEGIASKISDGKLAERLTRLLEEAGPKSRNLAEFGVGTNPNARLIGNGLEDEKALGTCHIALGDNSTFGGRVRAGIHNDGIFLNPTVKLDGKIMMKNGKLRV